MAAAGGGGASTPRRPSVAPRSLLSIRRVIIRGVHWKGAQAMGRYRCTRHENFPLLLTSIRPSFGTVRSWSCPALAAPGAGPSRMGAGLNPVVSWDRWVASSRCITLTHLPCPCALTCGGYIR